MIRKIPWVLSSLARPLLNAFASSSPVLVCPFPLRGCEDRLALLTCQLCISRGMVLLMVLDAFFAVSNFSISGWLRLRVWYRMPRCGGLPRRERALLISFRALIERGVESACLCFLIVRYDRWFRPTRRMLDAASHKQLRVRKKQNNVTNTLRPSKGRSRCFAVCCAV